MSDIEVKVVLSARQVRVLLGLAPDWAIPPGTRHIDPSEFSKKSMEIISNWEYDRFVGYKRYSHDSALVELSAQALRVVAVLRQAGFTETSSFGASFDMDLLVGKAEG